MIAKLYTREQIEAAQVEAVRNDYKDRLLQALWVHRWLDEPDRRFVNQLKGGGSAWPQIVREQQQYGQDDAKEPKPKLKPADITNHDKMMPMFNCLCKRDFNMLWLRGARRWGYQRIADKHGRTKQWAHMRVKQALLVVICEAARGQFEI